MEENRRKAIKDVIEAGTKLELYMSVTAQNLEQAEDHDRALDHFNACVEYYCYLFIPDSGTGTKVEHV